MNQGRWMLLGLATVSIVACVQVSNEGTVSPQPSPAETRPGKARAADPTPGTPDQWIGRWNGPEGTYLSIGRQGDGYTLEIADLDGPRAFSATRLGDHLVFERDGKSESIRATNGKQTGMKWLQDFSDCLTIHAGEGYCRS